MVTSNRLFCDQLQELITSTRVNIFWHFFVWRVQHELPYTLVLEKLLQMPFGLINFESKLILSNNLYFFWPFLHENRIRWPKFVFRFVINMKNLVEWHIGTESPTTYCRDMTSQSSEINCSTLWRHNSAIRCWWLNTDMFLD